MKHTCLKKPQNEIKISPNPSFSKSGNKRRVFFKEENNYLPLLAKGGRGLDFKVKKIIIANTQVPFVYEGVEYLTERLQKKLIEYGHKAETVKMLFKWYLAEKLAKIII